MTLRMLELGMPIDRILFADTKKEFRAMYAYLLRFQSYLDQNYPGKVIETVRTKDDWDRWMTGTVTRGKLKGRQRGWPLQAFPCWWSRESKFKMLDPACEGNDRYIGYCVDEPKRWKASKDINGYRFPMVDWGWTESDALAYLVSIDMDCQLHHDFDRTGCYCCPKQKKKNMEVIKEKYNEEWLDMLRMEDLAFNEFKPGLNLRAIDCGLEYCESMKKVEDMVDDQILFDF